MSKHNLATFRTEGFDFDNWRLPMLLEAMGWVAVSSEKRRDPVCNDWVMDTATVDLGNESFESALERLYLMVHTDGRFVDMHRCSDTFAMGLEPTEDWNEIDGIYQKNYSRIYDAQATPEYGETYARINEQWERTWRES